MNLDDISNVNKMLYIFFFMNSMQTCNSITFTFSWKKSYFLILAARAFYFLWGRGSWNFATVCHCLRQQLFCACFCGKVGGGRSNASGDINQSLINEACDVTELKMNKQSLHTISHILHFQTLFVLELIMKLCKIIKLDSKPLF